jgi:hypothetical protein
MDDLPFKDELAQILKHLKSLSVLPRITGDGHSGPMQYVSNNFHGIPAKNALVQREGGITFSPIKDLDEIMQKRILHFLQENDAIDLDMRYYMPPIPNPLFIINPEKFNDLYKKYVEPNRKVSAGVVSKDKATGKFSWNNKPIKLGSKNQSYALLDILVSRGLDRLVKYEEIDKHFRSLGHTDIDGRNEKIKRIHNAKNALMTQAWVDGKRLGQFVGANKFIEVEDGVGLRLVA